jgi:hypothetical protein
MAPPVRGKVTPPAPAGLNFGGDDFYGQSSGIPEGDYALLFDVVMHKYESETGPEKLKIRVTAHDLASSGEEPKVGYYSLGSKAHLSFQPDPETGKGVVAVPGGPASQANDKTNWNVFRKSLYDCGLPEGVFTNDISVLDGIWVHLSHIPEPEERAAFGAKTGEAQEQKRSRGTIAVVSEIKDDGKPWEGSGGIPEAEATKPSAKTVAKPGPKGVVKPPVKPAGKPAPPPPAEEGADEETLATGTDAVTGVLEANSSGVSKMKLRMETFKALKKSAGDEIANQIVNTFFGSDEGIEQLVGPLGFKVTGSNVVPA